MSPERKFMLSARLPAVVVERMDFVVKNMGIVDRTAAIREAIESWLLPREQRLRESGLKPPKGK